MKKIYSLNLISYLRSKGFKELEMGRNEHTGKVYYIFPQTEEVADAIKEYKNPKAEVVLHEFIENFKNIKKEIYEYNVNNKEKE